MIRKSRTLILTATIALMLSQHASAGVICEAIGRAWDKAAGKIVDVHKATQNHLKQSASRIKQAKQARR